MRTFHCLCLLLAMCLSMSLAQDDGYETFPSVPESRYKLYLLSHTWTEALSLCQGDGGGSHLVVINSQEEADIVKAKFASVTDANIHYLSVGTTDIVQEGTWVTVFGGPVSTSGYNVWVSGEPNNSAGIENCGSVDRDAHYNDVSCSVAHPFICEKPVE